MPRRLPFKAIIPVTTVLLGICLFGYDLFRDVTNPGGLWAVSLLLLLSWLSIWFVLTSISGSNPRLLKDKLAPILVIVGLVLVAEVLFTQRQQAIPLLIQVSTSPLVVVFLGLGLFLLVNVFNELKVYKRLFAVGLTVLIVSSLFGLLVLSANNSGSILFPDLSAQSQALLTNLRFILGLLLMWAILHQPRITGISSKGAGYLRWLVLIAVSVLLGLVINGVVGIFVLTLFLLILVASWQINRLQMWLTLLSLVIVIVVGMLLPKVSLELAAWQQQLGVVSAPQNLVAGVNVLLRQAASGKAITGSPELAFNEAYLQFQPVNNNSEYQTAIPDSSGSYVLDMGVKFGIPVMILLLLLVIYLFNCLPALQLVRHAHPVLADLLTAIVVLFGLNVLLGQVSLQMWMLLILAMAVLLHANSDDFWDIKGQKMLNLTFGSLLAIAVVAVTLAASWLWLIDQKYALGYAKLRFSGQDSLQIETIETIRTVVANNPYSVAYHQDLSQVYAALAAYDYSQGNPGGADNFRLVLSKVLSESNKAVELAPYSYWAWSARFKVLELLGDFLDTNEALNTAADKLLALAPLYYPNLQLMLDHFRDSDADKFGQIVQALYNANKNVPAAQLEYAKYLLASNRVEEAKDLLLAITEDSSRAADVVYQEAARMLQELIQQQSADTTAPEAPVDGSDGADSPAQ